MYIIAYIIFLICSSCSSFYSHYPGFPSTRFDQGWWKISWFVSKHQVYLEESDVICSNMWTPLLHHVMFRDVWPYWESSKTWHGSLKQDQTQPDKKLQSPSVFDFADSHFIVSPQRHVPLFLRPQIMCFQTSETSADPTNEEWFTCLLTGICSATFFVLEHLGWSVYNSQLKQRPKDKLTTRVHSQHIL